MEEKLRTRHRDLYNNFISGLVIQTPLALASLRSLVEDRLGVKSATEEGPQLLYGVVDFSEETRLKVYEISKNTAHLVTFATNPLVITKVSSTSGVSWNEWSPYYVNIALEAATKVIKRLEPGISPYLSTMVWDIRLHKAGEYTLTPQFSLPPHRVIPLDHLRIAYNLLEDKILILSKDHRPKTSLPIEDLKKLLREGALSQKLQKSIPGGIRGPESPLSWKEEDGRILWGPWSFSWDVSQRTGPYLGDLRFQGSVLYSRVGLVGLKEESINPMNLREQSLFLEKPYRYRVKEYEEDALSGLILEENGKTSEKKILKIRDLGGILALSYRVESLEPYEIFYELSNEGNLTLRVEKSEESITRLVKIPESPWNEFYIPDKTLDSLWGIETTIWSASFRVEWPTAPREVRAATLTNLKPHRLNPEGKSVLFKERKLRNTYPLYWEIGPWPSSTEGNLRATVTHGRVEMNPRDEKLPPLIFLQGTPHYESLEKSKVLSLDKISTTALWTLRQVSVEKKVAIEIVKK